MRYQAALRPANFQLVPLSQPHRRFARVPECVILEERLSHERLLRLFRFPLHPDGDWPGHFAALLGDAEVVKGRARLRCHDGVLDVDGRLALFAYESSDSSRRAN